jgi:hypothetical protein
MMEPLLERNSQVEQGAGNSRLDELLLLLLLLCCAVSEHQPWAHG